MSNLRLDFLSHSNVVAIGVVGVAYDHPDRLL